MQTPDDLPKITRRTLLAALPGLLLVGCAKAPSSGITSPASGPQVFATLTVAGRINPSYFYYVLFNINNTPSQTNSGLTGPVPVVAIPYGNGFAAGVFTNYAEVNATPNIGFYKQDPNNLLSTATPIGTGVFVQQQVSGNTISFQLPLSVLATSNGLQISQIQSLQVNFVATNVLPPPGDTLPNPPKVYCTLQNLDQPGNSFLNAIISPGGMLQPYNYQNTTSGTVYEYVNGAPIPATDQPGLTTADLSVTSFRFQVTTQ